MSERTPNFVTNEAISINFGKYDNKVIPIGSFVRPIELQYVPKHIVEDKRWERFDKEQEVFIFTRYGFLAVKKSSIRETM